MILGVLFATALAPPSVGATDDGLSLLVALQTNKDAYATGETVFANATVTNRMDFQLVIFFGSHCQQLLIVRDIHGAVVEDGLPAGLACTGAATNWTLQSGETRSFAYRWGQTDDRGVRVPAPRTYLLRFECGRYVESGEIEPHYAFDEATIVVDAPTNPLTMDTPGGSGDPPGPIPTAPIRATAVLGAFALACLACTLFALLRSASRRAPGCRAVKVRVVAVGDLRDARRIGVGPLPSPSPRPPAASSRG